MAQGSFVHNGNCCWHLVAMSCPKPIWCLWETAERELWNVVLQKTSLLSQFTQNPRKSGFFGGTSSCKIWVAKDGTTNRFSVLCLSLQCNFSVHYLLPWPYSGKLLLAHRSLITSLSESSQTSTNAAEQVSYPHFPKRAGLNLWKDCLVI